MIKDLSDFKSATKRLPKLLQTFDLSKPNIFKLSNSASLNLMARILGYENYNTIKPVFDKNNSKGKNKMKEIIIDEERTINAAFIVERGKRYGKLNGMLSPKEYHIASIDIVSSSESSYLPYIEFPFNREENAKKMYDEISNFLYNDESILDLHTMNQKLKNTDNRANQLNPNNNSN